MIEKSILISVAFVTEHAVIFELQSCLDELLNTGAIFESDFPINDKLASLVIYRKDKGQENAPGLGAWGGWTPQTEHGLGNGCRMLGL